MKLVLSPQKLRNSKGFALVIVLAFMAVLVGIVVGFLTRATTERKSSAGFGSAAGARQIGDSAISLVEAQINVATNQGSNVAWASQPGMVRTFDNTGNLLQAFKLYSATNMIDTSVSLTADVPPSSWTADTANWVDLNAPVTVGGVKDYPVVDPTGAKIADTDPAVVAVGNASIAGFDINNAPKATTAQPAPMPVRWLYQLQDGTLVSPTGSGKTATIIGDTASNPIVGRVGFWTDDETCKVNINTAAGDVNDPTKVGSFWDTPRYAGMAERQNYSDRIPVQNEFQRFPGHPASVYLSSIFPTLTRENIMAIAPRVQDGGTKGGTVDTKTSAQASAAKIDPGQDKDRLYASVDELVFKTTVDPDTGSRKINSGLSASQVEQAKFFITAQSRAPEVNLYNLPRVSMWPIYSSSTTSSPADDAYLSAFDKLIRHCTTVNGSGYYVKRKDSQSSTTDAALNSTLYSYLDTLTGMTIPGFGGNFQTKYPAARAQILVDMLDYIRSTNLSDTYVLEPNRFTSGDQKGQVVPMVMANGKMGFGRFYTLSEAGLVFSNESEVVDDPASTATPKATMVVSHSGITSPLKVPPASNPNKKGDKYIQPAWIMEPFCVAAGYTTIYPDSTWTVEGLGARFKVEDASGNKVSIFPAGAITQKMIKFDPGYRDLGDGEGAVGDMRSFINRTSTAPTYGTYKFLGTPFVATFPAPLDPNKPDNYDNQFKLIVDNTKPIIIKIFSGSNVLGTPVQTITLNFPTPDIQATTTGDETTGKVPAPRFEAALQSLSSRLSQLVAYAGNGSSNAEALTSPATYTWVSAWDTVRTVGVASGDMRQVAHLPNPPSTLFAKSGNFDVPFSGKTTDSLYNVQRAFRLSHNLEVGNHGSIYGYKSAKLYETGTRGVYPIPKYPQGLPIISGGGATGDYDTGVALLNDGAYINKPDEGVLSDNSPYFNYFSNYISVSTLDPAYFSPNRIIPSAGMFGSLPTDNSFRTLLFRKQPSHPNSRTPKDYLLMDLFWMPVVQPYAISEPFSTAGKINLNYQILPFTYISRRTALQAALVGEKYLALPILASGGVPNGVDGYKGYGNSKVSTNDYRKPVNTSFLFSNIQPLFDGGDIFKSATQICDYDLDSFDWETNSLTGDNVRERPYANIYQKLTTKSNTYTVHFCAQSLKKLKNSNPGTWTDGKDVVQAEYRGSTTIERFIDANDNSIPPYLTDPTNTNTLDKFYKWRVVANRQFAP